MSNAGYQRQGPIEPSPTRWSFPPPSTADENGLVGAGADLEPGTYWVGVAVEDIHGNAFTGIFTEGPLIVADDEQVDSRLGLWIGLSSGFVLLLIIIAVVFRLKKQ